MSWSLNVTYYLTYLQSTPRRPVQHTCKLWLPPVTWSQVLLQTPPLPRFPLPLPLGIRSLFPFLSLCSRFPFQLAIFFGWTPLPFPQRLSSPCYISSRQPKMLYDEIMSSRTIYKAKGSGRIRKPPSTSRNASTQAGHVGKQNWK